MEEKKLNYEQAMNRLEEIVRKLESGQTPLEDAIGLFDEGLGLVSQCEKQLKAFDDKLQSVLNSHKEEKE